MYTNKFKIKFTYFYINLNFTSRSKHDRSKVHKSSVDTYHWWYNSSYIIPCKGSKVFQDSLSRQDPMEVKKSVGKDPETIHDP